MRAVLQRVSRASVEVSGSLVGEIGPGLLVLLGIQEGDGPADVEWLAQKTSALRIFPDVEGLMNRSVVDVKGGALVVSQFTLIASTRKGTRPSFSDAAKPDVAHGLYEAYMRLLGTALGRPVASGQFAAEMKVALVNDGPVTIILDSRVRA